MAFEGELVKLNNGRWARFQRCQVSGGDGYQSSMLVAVELEARYQQMLDEAHGEYLGARRLTLDPDAKGELSLQVTEAAAY